MPEYTLLIMLLLKVWKYWFVESKTMTKSFRLMACLVLFIKRSAPIAEPKKHLFLLLTLCHQVIQIIKLVYAKTKTPTKNCLCRAPCYATWVGKPFRKPWFWISLMNVFAHWCKCWAITVINRLKKQFYNIL